MTEPKTTRSEAAIDPKTLKPFAVAHDVPRSDLPARINVPASGSAAPPRVPPAVEPIPATPEPAMQGTNAVLPLRPLLRPPMAVLVVLDDGNTSAEYFRIRKPRFVIGRTDGDVVISHDDNMSGQHVEITRELRDGKWTWQLNDLGSRNGTFVKLTRRPARIMSEQVFQVGLQRIQFRLPVSIADPPAPAIAQTRDWKAISPADISQLVPRLVHLDGSPMGRTFPIQKPIIIIGRDAACDVPLTSDGHVNPTHARVYRERDDWLLEDSKSENGTWLRLLGPHPIGRSCEFILGEQRFQLKVL